MLPVVLLILVGIGIAFGNGKYLAGVSYIYAVPALLVTALSVMVGMQSKKWVLTPVGSALQFVPVMLTILSTG